MGNEPPAYPPQGYGESGGEPAPVHLPKQRHCPTCKECCSCIIQWAICSAIWDLICNIPNMC